MSMAAPIPSTFKSLPGGEAWCCGAPGCKGILARAVPEWCLSESDVAEAKEWGIEQSDELEMPEGFMFKDGLWFHTNRPAGRFTHLAKSARLLVQELENGALQNPQTQERILTTARFYTKQKKQSAGEAICEGDLPTMVRCPSCKKTGIILSVRPLR